MPAFKSPLNHTNKKPGKRQEISACLSVPLNLYPQPQFKQKNFYRLNIPGLWSEHPSAARYFMLHQTGNFLHEKKSLS